MKVMSKSQHWWLGQYHAAMSHNFNPSCGHHTKKALFHMKRDHANAISKSLQ